MIPAISGADGSEKSISEFNLLNLCSDAILFNVLEHTVFCFILCFSKKLQTFCSVNAKETLGIEPHDCFSHCLVPQQRRNGQWSM